MIKTNSAGGIVVNSEGKVLVVDQAGISWSLPKGHVEKGEEFLETAKREIYEESGLEKIEFIRKLGSYERDSLIDLDELKTIHIFFSKLNKKI